MTQFSPGDRVRAVFVCRFCGVTGSDEDSIVGRNGRVQFSMEMQHKDECETMLSKDSPDGLRIRMSVRFESKGRPDV